LTLFTVLQNAARGQAVNKSELRIIEDKEKFLRDFAKMMGFDPLIFSNWRNQTSNIKANGVTIHLRHNYILVNIGYVFFKGASLLAEYGSLKLLLKNTFPEINIEEQGTRSHLILVQRLKLFQIFAA